MVQPAAQWEEKSYLPTSSHIQHLKHETPLL